MKTRMVGLLMTLAVWVGLMVVTTPVFAQLPGYPAPRYPKLPKIESAKDLLAMARTVVRSPSRRETLRPGYGIKPGEKVLMVIPSDFSPLVADALAMAAREAGAEVDMLMLQAAGENPEEMKGGVKEGPQDGTIEGSRMLEPPRYETVGGATQLVQRGRVGSYALVLALGKGGRYDLVIEGSSGPQPVSSFRWERIPWDTVEKFVVSAGFPGEVQDLIDQKIWDTLKNARRVRVTDPEGTDLKWSIRPEYFARLKEAYDDPIYPPGTYDVVKRGHVSLTPLFMAMAEGDAEGTVAGTMNHAGVFPSVTLHVKGGQIARAEGGGRYGETINAALKKWAAVQYPGFPGPGIGWYIESALGTNPQRARVRKAVEGESMLWERGRSGVIHFGFGVSTPVTADNTPAMRKKVAEENVPGGHLHIHTYFNTIVVETSDGRTVTVADKGRITFLDDPEVRKLAAKYGDPDVMLREAWIPAVPGINVPGDYADYARNPAPWVIKDVENLRAAQKE